MALFRRGREESRDNEALSSALNNPSNSVYQALTLSGGLDASGPDGLPAVNMATAPRLSAVYRSVAIIANTIAGLPLEVEDRQPDGSYRPVFDAADELVWGTPCPESTAIQFWSTVIAHCVLAGDAFIHVGKNGLGDPRELWPIYPPRVRVSRTAPDETGRRHKAYQLDGDNEPLFDFADGGSVIHVPNLSLDGLRGMNPIAYMRRSLQLAAATETFGTTVFANGALPGGVITVEGDLTREQHDKLLHFWEKRHLGPSRAGKIAIVDNNAKFNQTSVTPEDAQFLDTRRFQVQEIARIFGVPPHLLYETTANTSWGSGLEELTSGFVTFTCGSYSGRFEQAATSQVFYRKPLRRARFNYEALLRGKFSEHMAGIVQGVMNGIFNPDEGRRRLGMGPRPDGLGGVFLRPAQMVEAGSPGLSGPGGGGPSA